MKNFTSLLLFAALGIFLFAGCGDNPQRKGPQETAEAFLAALQNGDYDRAKDFCTDGSRNSLSMFETFSGFGANPFAEEFTIVREEVSDQYARVFYTQGDEEKEKFVRLRHESGRWEVIANKADFTSKDDEKDNNDILDSDDKDSEADKDARHANQNKSLREGKSAEEIADAFLTAMMFGDQGKAKKLASKSSDMAISMQKENGIKSMEGFTIKGTEEKGEYATVTYVEKGETAEKELSLRKDANGNWEVIMSKNDSPSDS